MDKKPFDFEKDNVDPSKVLLGIWALVQSRLTKPILANLNSTFISHGILIPEEIAECQKAEVFLQLLSARSNSLKGKAINVICSVGVLHEIREKVQSYFPQEVAKVPQMGTKKETLDSGDIIISGKEKIDLVIGALIQDDALDSSWSSLGHALGLRSPFVYHLRTQRITGVIDEFDIVLRKLVEKWVQQKGQGATVSSLCEILKGQGLILCRDAVIDAFHKWQKDKI